jgi:hypothetical protein
MNAWGWDSIEAAAEALYSLANQDPGEALPPFTLARRLGIRVFTVHGASLPGLAALCRVGTEWRIYQRAKLDAIRDNWAIAHELGEWFLAQRGEDGPEREGIADGIAAAILVPRRSFQRALATQGPSLTALSSALGVTETLVALRVGEVVGTPIALVAPRRVRVRGAEFAWPEENALRQVANAQEMPGLRYTRLKDDPRRVMLIGEAG